MIYLVLFITFLKIGLFSFGGGYAMIPLMQYEVIYHHKWLSNSEFMNILAISQCTPGPIAINLATFLGYKIANIGGAIVSTFAVVLPSLIIVLSLSYFYFKYHNLKLVKRILNGIKISVLSLIFSVGISLFTSMERSITNTVFVIFYFLLLSFFKINPLIVIIISGIIGIIFKF